MAVEAQRLIAVSLGKISQSRSQRGGINLHKNLLVASVLYKARTVFIMENTRTTSQSDSESSDEESTTWDSTDGEHSEGAPASGTDRPDGEAPIVSPASLDQVVPEFDDVDKENSFPDDNDDAEVFESENSSPDYPKLGNCQKCHKRRLTDVDSEYTTHDSAGDNNVVSKKPRLELAESQRDNQYGHCEQEQSTGPETVQITTLVNSFNSGFTGLLNTDSPCSPKEAYVSSPPQVQGHSADSLISCSTQIKEAFETLARPILALTV